MIIQHAEKRPIEWKKKLVPLVLTAILLTIDQITKALIVAFIPLHRVGVSLLGDFFRIIHTRNLGIAFSLGNGMSDGLRVVLLTVLPALVLVVLFVFYYLRTKELTRFQEWLMAGIFGGGLGNLIDRAFRPEGVVDFLDFKFYGIFGLERWPTFNVADMSVVICVILFLVTVIFTKPAAQNKSNGAAS